MQRFVIRIISQTSGLVMHEIPNVTRVTSITPAEVTFEKVGHNGTCRLNRLERVEVDPITEERG